MKVQDPTLQTYNIKIARFGSPLNSMVRSVMTGWPNGGVTAAPSVAKDWDYGV